MSRSSISSSEGAVLTAMLAIAGCGDPKTTGTPTPGGGGFGSIGLLLQVAPDVALNSVSYDISGNGFSKSGTMAPAARAGARRRPVARPRRAVPGPAARPPRAARPQVG